MKKLTTILLMAGLCLNMQAEALPKYIDLSGTWLFALDRNKTIQAGTQLTETIQLPGTTDTNKKGDYTARSEETTQLSRLWSYKGRAWYQKEVDIPVSWKGKPVYLTLERTKPSEVYVDGKFAASSNDISTPQVFELSKWLKPGKHQLTIMIDNGYGVPKQLYESSHAYTESTQTNWNGIIGKIELSIQLPSPSQVKVVHQNFRDFHIEGQHFYANGHVIYLRGKHDACVWPLTGHVAMDVESWRKYLGTCGAYGINHIRFHSWCPPEAAFVAADELGIIMQPELPFWGSFDEQDDTLMTFLHKEGVNILRTYGHHPSFRMFALGNELWGSIEKMAEFVEDFRKIAPDKFYTFGSNYYLGYQGVKKGMDYFTTCRVGGEGWGNYNTHTRGSFSFADAADGGVINHFYPNTMMNFEEGCQLAYPEGTAWTKAVPVISHETAQFQTYPDYDEIKKYTGVLYPYNMEVFRNRLEKAGMLDQAKDFHKASGLWSLQLYKQDIEMDLRTRNMAGFQLLDLQDYPGQGSAYVGILNAFMEPKGICTEREWRQWCAPVVPLLIADRFCFTNQEGIRAWIQVANYSGESLNGKTLCWQLTSNSKGVASGNILLPSTEGLFTAGELCIDLSAFDKPTKLQLSLSIGETEYFGAPYHNTYDLWVYPAWSDLSKLESLVMVTNELNDIAISQLQKGKSVLLMPDSTDLCVGGLFTTDYWNYRMFKTISENNKKPVSPGTLGILTDPNHPIFNGFPTEMHTNWQWFPIVKASHPMILDNTSPDYRPIIQVIDNVERNHKLGLVFEFQVDKGKLLVCMADLEAATSYPEGRAFYRSVLEYMTSEDFTPKTQITLEDFKKLMTNPVVEGKIGELNNISPY
ncbi:sugar-binding domain-containing protein [Prevotella sp. khp7]|uniref:sugar-binding domain-containing protein n=1 Tax=Prevotella sp. khp7 TaxID=1761885 RepID=UPI000B80CFF8|nr:sugar-binding domain-containing protein [Prevotella sp. khp7]